MGTGRTAACLAGLLVTALVATIGGIARADDPPATPPDAPANGPAKVAVGVFVNDVQSIDLKLHSYAVDLYVWFRWTDPDLPSPATTIEFVNPSELWGQVRTPSYEEPITLPSGEKFQVLRVQGRFSRKFLFDSYPFDRQTLTVTFEDGQREAAYLVYAPDATGITVNPDLLIPGFGLGTPRLEVKEYAYPTNFGDPRHAKANVYSRVTVELPISRPTGTSTIKFLLPVLCVVLCAALMLILRPSFVDSRIGIGITSMLTIVALQITTNDDLPNVDYLILMDKIYVGAYVYVIAGLAVVVRTTKLDDPAAAERLHRRALLLLTGAFCLVFTVIVGRAIVVG